MALDKGGAGLYQLAPRSPNAVPTACAVTAMTPTPLQYASVMVDLTPLLPGGGNGGAKWFALSLLAEMARQRPGWRWFLITTAGNNALLAERFPAMVRVKASGGDGHAAQHPDPASLPGGGCAELLFCPFTAPFYANRRVPTIATVYDLQFLAYPQFFSRVEVEERAGNFFRAAALADRLVCISDFVRDDVCRAIGLDERWVKRVHISLPGRLAVPDAAALAPLLARHGLARGRYLLYPANTWPHKNHDMLLTAAGMYFARHPMSDLKIVCPGASDDGRGVALKAAAARMGLGARVIFPGFLDEEALAGLLAAARALIFPSLFEGFGMPLLEAMAFGVPVLSADTTSLPEIAGDAALLFDPRRPHDIVRAIAAIEEDAALAERLAAAGRTRAAGFGDAATMAAAYLALFDEVIAERQRVFGALRRRLRLLGREGSRMLVRKLHEGELRPSAWLRGHLQLARAYLGRRLPRLKALAGRLRGVRASAES